MSAAVPSGESALGVGKEDVSKKGASGGKEKDNSSNRPECSSPEIAKCAICLGDVVNRSRSNSCIHQFCFGCLLEWSKVKPECPLCKSSFRAIHHNFRSNTDFDEYVVPVPAVPHLSIRFTTSGVSQDIMMVREGDFATSYGLDLSLMRDAFIRDRRYIRVLGSGHQNPPISHAYDGISIPPAHSHSMPHYPHAHSSAHQRLPPSPNMPPPPNPFNNNRHEYFGDIITDHRRSQEESFQLPGYQNRRRRYDREEWVEPFGISRAGGDISSVDYIRGHPNALARLNNWLHRELTVLLGLHRSREEMGFIYELILHLLNQYDIRSREFLELIRTYFTERSHHFQHEFYHFLVSGMTMEVYDRMAEYPTTINAAANGRRTVAPEIITLDSDDEQQHSNSRSSDVVQEVRRREQLDDDIILLDSSTDDEESGMSGLGRLRPPRDNLGPHESYRNHAPGAAGDGSSSSSTRSFSSIDFDSLFQMPQLGVSITRRSEDIDRPQLLPSSSRVRTFAEERDPSMPVLEPQVFPYPSQTSAGSNLNNSVGRPRAPEVPQPLPTHSPEVELIHPHLIRPSVLSNSSTGNSRNNTSSNDRIRFMEADFDFDLNVSLERYSSPPGRQTARPLATPDFPILELRRNLLERERDIDMAREISQDDLDSVWPLLSSFSTRSRPRVPDNGSAFVPYEPELTHSTANEVRRPPRPSCIHERGSANASSSRLTSSSVLRPPTPPFRIDLYPHGISSSQVMDLSRSAGLVSSNAPSSSRPRTRAPEPVAGPSCSKVSQKSVLSASSTSLNPLSSTGASASSAAMKNEPIPPPANVESDSDELECLGSFPIIKKPPLAVITLSSDGEEENVKTENNEERLNNLISEEDIDSFLNWNLPTETDLIDVGEDVSATTVLDDNCQSSSSSSNLLSITPQHASSSPSTGKSAVPPAKLSNPFKISIRNISGKRDGFTASLGESTSQASTSSTDMTKSEKYPTPKRSRGRKRIYYLSDDSSDEDVNNKVTQGSSKSFPVSIPKKRRFVEPSISPVSVQTQPDFDSCSSISSEDSSETDFEDNDAKFGNIKRSRSSKSKKRSSSPKKKHKSKSKKSKKSKRGKDKEKKDRSKKDKSKGKKFEDLFGSDSDTNDLNIRGISDSVRNDSVVITNKAPSSSKRPTKSSKASASATSSSSLTLQQSE